MSDKKFTLPPKPAATAAGSATLSDSSRTQYTSVKEFGDGAEAPTSSSDAPWAGKDNKSRRPAFNLRPTEAEKIMMDYVLKHTTYKSLHDMVMSIVMPEIKAQADTIFTRNKLR